MTSTRNGASTIEHEIGPRGELALRVQTGAVEVRGTGGSVVVVRDLDGRDLDDGFEVERQPGRLSIRPRDRVVLDLGFLKRGRAGGRLLVELPAAASLSIDTANADVRASGLTGEQRYRTASGELVLRDVAGPIGVDTVSGDVMVEAAGAVALSGRLVSGDLQFVGGRLESVALATTSGDLRLLAPLAGPGPYSIQTVSGDVEVVAGEAGLRVEARTVTGDISTEAPSVSDSGRGRRSLAVGAGRLALAFKSISGDLHVATVAGSGGVHSHASPEPPAPPEPPAAPEPPEPPSPPDVPGATRADAGTPAAADPAETARLEILRDLEAGTISVETATRRLAELEDRIDG